MHKNLQIDDFSYWNTLERSWRTNAPKMNQKELYLTFLADGPEIITEKLKELDSEHAKLESEIIDDIKRIKKASKTEIEKLLMQGVLEQTDINSLLVIEQQIRRFRLYENYKDGKPSKELRVEEAKTYPIYRLCEREARLRPIGRNFVGLCPLHKEKTPSFHIYTKNNSFYCFGCKAGGDVITLVRLLYAYSFPEAISYLVTNL